MSSAAEINPDNKRAQTLPSINVTPDKKAAWALSPWEGTNLGTSTSIRSLDEPGVPEFPGNQQR